MSSEAEVRRSGAADRGRTLAAAVGGVLLAAGLIGLGATLSGGLLKFRSLERTVEVKGLAEREVPADLAIWTVAHTDADNDLGALYARFEAKNARIVAFLGERGFQPAEITASAPSVVDRQAREYGEQGGKFRYTGRASVTVYSPKVDAVRKGMGELGELGKNGIAVSGEGAGAQFLFEGLAALKPAMVEEATRNARETASKFAADSASALGKLKRASQGQFSISDRDASTPHIKKVRVVSTIEYYLQD
jgi:hypothetical protein